MAVINTADLMTLDALGIVQPLPAAWVASKKLVPAFSAGRCHGGEACALPFQRSVPVWYFNQELLFKLRAGHRAHSHLVGEARASLPATTPRQVRFGESPFQKRAAAPSSAGRPWALSPLLSPEALSSMGAPHVGESGLLASWSARSPKRSPRLFLEQRAVVMLGTLDQLVVFREQRVVQDRSDPARNRTSSPGTARMSSCSQKGRNAELRASFSTISIGPRFWLKLAQAATSLAADPRPVE